MARGREVGRAGVGGNGLAEGKSAALVQEAMGHSDIRVTLQYSHLAREHLKALVSDAKAPDSNQRTETA
jgi:integrase